MSKTGRLRHHVMTIAAVLLLALGPPLCAQILPGEEYLDIIRTVDGSILTGRIIAGYDETKGDTATGPVTIEIYGGSQFVVVPENVVSISRSRNPDYGREIPVLRLGDFTERSGQEGGVSGDEEERSVPAETAALRTVRYPSFSGGIGLYAPLALTSGSDRMIDGPWSASGIGIHIHAYDLIPLTIGIDLLLTGQDRNGNYETYDGTQTPTGDDYFYPFYDGTYVVTAPSILAGNHWQSVAVGATWIGIHHERPLFMPTVQWRNLRVAASLADEGYLSAQYHLPIDARANEAREEVDTARSGEPAAAYTVQNNVWTRYYVRLNDDSIAHTDPEFDYQTDLGDGEVTKSVAVGGPEGGRGAAGIELNRTFWNRLDVGLGIEVPLWYYGGNVYLTDVDTGRSDSYGIREAIGGFFRLAGYASERMWAYGRFGMTITELYLEFPADEPQDRGFPEIPNHSYYSRWWSEFGIGVGFLRRRSYGIDLEGGPRFSILQTGDVTDNQDPASIGFSLQASVRRNEAPVSHRYQAADGGFHPAARALGKPIWVRFAGGFRSNDQWVALGDPIDITAAGTEYQGVTDYSYWDSEFHGAAEAAVQLLPAHAIGLRFQTNLTNIYSFIDVNTDGDEYRHLETDIAIPYGMFIFHHLTWRALGLKTQAGFRVAHLRYPDDPVFRELYDDDRTFFHWGVAIGPTVRLFQFGDDDQHQIDLGITYRHEWIDLQAVFDETLSAPGYEVEIGYTRRFGER